MRTAWLRFGGLPALGVAALLTIAVTIGWCIGTGVKSVRDLHLPTAYLDAEKSDVLFNLAHLKAAQDGHFVPFTDKTIPQLGAPHQAHWSDWPLIEEIPLWIMGLVARATDVFVALNLGLLAGHLLAALTFFAVARQFAVRLAWSFLGAFAFGLAPFFFAQSPHHLGIQLCWYVPLFLPVWEWVTEEPGIEVGSRRFWYACTVGAVAGAHYVYFSFVFCQLILLGAGANYWRTRARGPLLSAALILAATAAAFALLNLDTWMFRLHHGPNPAAVVRPYQWLELYGLKAVDLVCPPSTHALQPVAQWAAQHWRAGILIDEGSYLGILGLVGLLTLGFHAGRAIVRRSLPLFPLAAWQGLWIFAFFSTGGLNLALGLFGFTLFRANCRLSIVLLAIALLFLLRRGIALRARAAVPLAAALAILVAFDQVPRPASSTERAAIARQIADDQNFVRAMEKALPRGSMVLQLPFAAYPESPIPGMTVYDHFRPYLYSQHLRFSFGAVKGRADTEAYSQLAKQPAASLVKSAQAAGFRAIYLNRSAFSDQAKSLVSELSKLGFNEIIESRRGDLACVVLK